MASKQVRELSEEQKIELKTLIGNIPEYCRPKCVGVLSMLRAVVDKVIATGIFKMDDEKKTPAEYVKEANAILATLPTIDEETAQIPETMWSKLLLEKDVYGLARWIMLAGSGYRYIMFLTDQPGLVMSCHESDLAYIRENGRMRFMIVPGSNGWGFIGHAGRDADGITSAAFKKQYTKSREIVAEAVKLCTKVREKTVKQVDADGFTTIIRKRRCKKSAPEVKVKVLHELPSSAWHTVALSPAREAAQRPASAVPKTTSAAVRLAPQRSNQRTRVAAAPVAADVEKSMTLDSDAEDDGPEPTIKLEADIRPMSEIHHVQEWGAEEDDDADDEATE